MGTRLPAPGPQEKRFAAYIEGLAKAAGYADRHGPVKNYCKGLLARDDVRRMHQSLQIGKHDNCQAAVSFR